MLHRAVGGVMLVLLVLALPSIWAMEVRLEPGGRLTFSGHAGASGYRIERAASPSGPWEPFEQPHRELNTLEPFAGDWKWVNVPFANPSGFFRVVAEADPQFDASLRIEAEDYSDMLGVQLEAGDAAIGWFDEGDWLRFNAVDFGAGAGSVTISAAKSNGAGGHVELRLDALDGALVGTFFPEETGGWSNYQEQSLNLEGVAGVRDLYLIARGADGVCNLDGFHFSAEPIYEPKYELVWEDGFNGTALDTSKWSAVYHGDVDNNELQFYTDRPENIEVSGGMLRLTARRETFTGRGPWMNQARTSEYTSGKVESLSKAEFQYGRIEARIRMPRGEGTWPAFWMLGSNLFDPGVGWPKSGEIDIMEHANVQDTYTAAIHTEAYNHTIGTQKVGGIPISTYDTQFHVYGVEWTADKLEFYLDDTVFFTARKSELGDSQAQWPFDQPFWLILNLAVGGPYGGDPSNGDYPYTMEVDWVRVYQDQGSPPQSAR